MTSDADALPLDPGLLPSWALVWINELAEDILAVVEEWQPLFVNTRLNLRRRNTSRNRDVDTKLDTLLRRYRAENRPLPGSKDRRPMHAHLAREIGDFCQRHQRSDGIPLVNGQRWKLVTSQFRLVKIYAESIRQLTLDNLHLETKLNAAANVTTLPRHATSKPQADATTGFTQRRQ